MPKTDVIMQTPTSSQKNSRGPTGVINIIARPVKKKIINMNMYQKKIEMQAHNRFFKRN